MSMTCQLFDSILELIVEAIYRYLISIYSECLNICYGSCTSLYKINVSRD